MAGKLGAYLVENTNLENMYWLNGYGLWYCALGVFVSILASMVVEGGRFL